MPNDATRGPPPTRKEAREARLVLELRANLGRRKALSRSRSAAAGPQAADEATDVAIVCAGGGPAEAKKPSE